MSGGQHEDDELVAEGIDAERFGRDLAGRNGAHRPADARLDEIEKREHDQARAQPDERKYPRLSAREQSFRTREASRPASRSARRSSDTS